MNYELFYPTDKECASCFDNMNKHNYVLYKDNEQGNWMPCIYCSVCIDYMLKSNWENYVKQIDTADCAVALKRLIERGPPINFRDNHLECKNETGEVYKFYYDNAEQSSKLHGSLTGDEREKWLQDKSEILSIMESIKDTKR